MQKPLIRLLLWFGIMAILTVVAMSIWFIVWNGDQSTESLKWLQFLQTSATFLIPPILCAWLWDDHHRPFEWLKMNRGIRWQTAVLAILIMICAIPGINLLADWNSRIELPESLASIEQILNLWIILLHWMRMTKHRGRSISELQAQPYEAITQTETTGEDCGYLSVVPQS